MPKYIPARANAEGTTLTEYPLDIHTAYPDASFPPDIEQHNLTDKMIAEGVELVLMIGQPQGNFLTVDAGEPALVDGHWQTTWVTTSRDLDGWKDTLKEQAGSARYTFETGGFDLPNGAHVNTATDDQNRITSVLVNAERAGLTAIKFKSTSGFVTMTLDELRGIANAITLHVQDAFNWEEARHEEIDALVSVEDAEQYASGLGKPVSRFTPLDPTK